MTMRTDPRVNGIVMALLLSVSLSPLLLACGGSADEVRVSSPFTDEHAKLFGDSLDFVADVNALEGRFREEWQAEMDRRMELSDLVARVTVATVRTSQERDRTTLQLDLTVTEVLHGASPGASLSVSVREGEPGYPSVKSNETSMPNADFLLFVKWYVGDTRRVVPHWHLAPDTEVVRALVTSRVELMNRPATPPPRLSW